ncbi:MAG TPA: FAD binding domain-containing protein [Chloroflexota bacterium]|nr:FAD binding domain-containing protein [Chloroflexota bacterium]
MRNLELYLRPESPQQAVEMKRQRGDEAVYLGGGSDLLVHRPDGARVAIDIRHAGISRIWRQDGHIHIGGATLLRDVELDLPQVAGGMLREAVRETAPWLIRNAATLAGNIANASPAADAVPALLALDAQLNLLGEFEESASLEDTLVGPHQTALRGRLIHNIFIDKDAARRTGAFIKLSRSKSDIAQVNVAVAFRRDGTVVRDVRIALGAVAPTAIRAHAAEAELEGRPVGSETLESVARVVATEVRPISDWRASADYRRRMSAVLVRRAIESAYARSGNGV